MNVACPESSLNCHPEFIRLGSRFDSNRGESARRRDRFQDLKQQKTPLRGHKNQTTNCSLIFSFFLLFKTVVLLRRTFRLYGRYQILTSSSSPHRRVVEYTTDFELHKTPKDKLILPISKLHVKTWEVTVYKRYCSSETKCSREFFIIFRETSRFVA